MPSIYGTLPVDSKLVQNKTEGFLLLDINDEIDVGHWWQQTGGSEATYLKATIVRPDGSTIVKVAEDLEIYLDNTAPQRVRLLFLPEDLTAAGAYKVLVEFKIGDGWLPAETITLTVEDDPTT